MRLAHRPLPGCLVLLLLVVVPVDAQPAFAPSAFDPSAFTVVVTFRGQEVTETRHRLLALSIDLAEKTAAAILRHMRRSHARGDLSTDTLREYRDGYAVPIQRHLDDVGQRFADTLSQGQEDSEALDVAVTQLAQQVVRAEVYAREKGW